MKLLYAPAVLSLAVLVSLGSQSLASNGQLEPAVSFEGKSIGIPLLTEPLFGILSGMVEAESSREEPSDVKAPDVKAPDLEVNPGPIQGSDPRNWDGYNCPACGRG
jgi:hypothetical protein